jgi:hypothetical protein
MIASGRGGMGEFLTAVKDLLARFIGGRGWTTPGNME